MRKKILVVDDNRLMREFMTNLLQGQGMQVFLAENGFAALDALTNIRPDIIFIDLIMPKIDGSKLCRIIRNMAHLEDTFLVVVSAAAAEIGDDYKAFGADACIAKGAFDQMAKHVLAVIELAEKKEAPGPVILGAEKVQPRQMTQELLRRNRHLETIIDSISHGIIETYANRIVYANPAVGFLFHQPPESLIGRTFPDLFNEKVQPQITSLVVEEHIPPPGAVNTRIPSGQGERHVVVKRLDMATDMETRLFVLTDTTESVRADTRVQETQRKLEAEVARRTADLTRTNEQLSREIAEREKTSAALSESQKRFEEFMKHMPSLAFIKDLDGRYLFANQAYRKFTGTDPEARIGKTDADLWPPDIANSLRENDIQVIESGEALVKVEVVEVDNQPRHHLVSKFPIFKDGKPHALGGIAVDITHRVQVEEERIKLIEKLQNASKMEAVGNLAGHVAHDLNNILSGVVSYPELMLMDMDADNPMYKPLLTIKKAGKRAAATVQDLLVLVRRDIAVNEVVNLNDIVDRYRGGSSHHRILNDRPTLRVDTRLAPNLMNIVGTPGHLEKCLEHLVNHAAGAGQDVSHVEITTANVQLKEPVSGYTEINRGNYISLTVKDDGPSLEPEQRERIFEPFFTSKVLGRKDTGLGMVVVQGTVNDHRGYIDLQSDGSGNRFTLYFPATRKTTVGNGSTPADPIQGNGETILVVDDVADQRRIARNMLEKLGYRVETVTSGEEAVKWLKDQPADLVLLDMIMEPGIDGLETYRQILALRPRQKAIIASGYSESERVREAQRLGTGVYIKKPYLIEEIGSALHRELTR